MRFLSLEALAFGPFTNKAIDLSDSGTGLHVIFGRNESGKSSALRALRQFLYGIPANSRDDFIHPYANMRIAATILRSDGTTLKLVRKKGNKNTLRDAGDKNSVDDSVLKELLAGIDQRQFEVMFGLDHDTLIRGGDDLLSGSNDIGQVIFTGGASISGIAQVLGALDEQAKELFKPSGQNPRINAALKRLSDLRSQLKTLQLSQTEWSKHEQALADALASKEHFAREHSAAQVALRRLERIRDAHVIVCRRTLDLQGLEALGSVVSLPPDFADRARDLLVQQQNATTGHAQAQEKITALARQLSDIHLPLEVLAHAESIDALYKELGGHLKAAEDRLKRERDLQTCEAEARSILKALGKDVSLEDAEALCITSQQRALLQEMMRKAERVLDGERTARERLTRIERELASYRQQLSELPAERKCGPLHSELMRLQKLGPLEDRLSESAGDLAKLASRIENGKARLSLAHFADDQISTLPVPMAESIDAFQQQLDDSSRRIDELRQRIREALSERDKTQQHIDKLELEMDVPTEGVLDETRQNRDHGWQLIKRWWLSGERDEESVASFTGFSSGPDALAGAYEHSVATSDETGDRLRREAQRVGQKASLLAQRENIDKRVQDFEIELADAVAASEDIHQKWASLWAPIRVTALTPKEMTKWRSWFDALTQLIEDAQVMRVHQAQLARQVEAARADILAQLASAGEHEIDETRPLAYLFDYAQRAVERLSEQAAARQALRRDVGRLEDELNQQQNIVQAALAGLAEWSESWRRAVAPLGIPEQSTTAEAQAVLDRLDELALKLKERADLIHRIAGITRDSGDYSQRVASLASIAIPGKSITSWNIAVDDMRAKLKEAQDSQSEHKAKSRQREEQTEIAKSHEQALTDSTNALSVMCAEAGCKTPAELLPIAKKSEEVRALRQRVSQLDEQLAPLCGELPLAEFVQAVEAADHDSLPSQIDQLKATIAELDEKLEAVNQTIGSERVELERMNGAGEAAIVAEQLESECAQIRELSQQYARLKLSEVILRGAIERYREKNQSPVLKRASEIFAGLTCGSFAALRCDVDDHDATILLGVRAGVTAGEVGLGGMSEGTRDQVYLALRLASIEHILKGHEPIPFVVDDILVNFDDDRAVAALEALAELSRTTQVIFFTHHAHLVDLAKRTLPASNLYVHDLDLSPLVPTSELSPAKQAGGSLPSPPQVHTSSECFPPRSQAVPASHSTDIG